MARHTNSLRRSCQTSFSRKIRTNIRKRPERSRRQNIDISASQIRKSRPECRGKLNKRFSKNSSRNKKNSTKLVRTLLGLGLTLAVIRQLQKKQNQKNNPNNPKRKTRKKTRRKAPLSFGIYSSPRDLTSSRKPKRKFTGLRLDFDV